MMKRGFRSLGVIVAAVALSLTGFGEELDESLFAKTSTLTVNYTGAETLEGFPVLVRLSANSPTGFSYADCAEDGSDLRFADDDGNLLAHEIDTWNSEGESTVWVRLPRLPVATVSTFKLYYGVADESALPAVTASDVWTKYVAVVHGGSSIENASASGLLAYAANGVAASATAGLVGWGITKASRSSIGLDIQNPVKNAKLADSNKFTVSGWFRKSTGCTGTSVFMTSVKSWGGSGFLGLCEGGTYFSVAVSGTHQGAAGQGALVGGTWNHAAFSYATAGSTGSIRSYWDGVNIYASDTAKAISDQGNGYWTFGSYSDAGSVDSYAGDMDELRIYDGIASAAWIAAEHDTVATTTFVSLGDVTSTGGSVPLTIRDNGIVQTGNTATFFGRLANIGTGATSATVKLYWGTSADVTAGNVAEIGTYTDRQDFQKTITNLVPAQRYYYAFKAENDVAGSEPEWTEVNTFVVDASTKVSDTVTIQATNCKIAITGDITSWGVGTTTAELLIGTSPANLQVVDRLADLSSEPEGGLAFAPVTLPVGTYYYVIRTATTYNGTTWVNETSAENTVVVSDASTYTWKTGASGLWNDAANWTTSDEGAVGYPTAGSSVIFPAGDSLVLIPNLTDVFASVKISSVGTHAFRSTDRPGSIREIKATETVLSGDGGGTLVFDTVKMTTSRPSTLAGVRKLVLENSAEFAYPKEPDLSDLELTLVNGGKFMPNWISANVGKLKVGLQYNYIERNGTNSIVFAGFENLGGLGYCNVQDGAVSFTDVSGIVQIGGEGTYESNTSQIKVAPEFLFNAGTWNPNKGIATISNNVVVALASETMLQGFEGATALDNVYIGSAGATLSSDVTVNAVLFDGNLDLGGHTLTIRSGLLRQGFTGSPEVKNGTVCVANPGLMMDNINNTTVRFTAQMATTENTDPWRAMMAFWVRGGAYPTGWTYENFIGRLIYPGSVFSPVANRLAANCVVDMVSGSVRTGGHNTDYVMRGLAGNAQLIPSAFNNTIWIGDCNDEQFAQLGQNEIANWGVVVSTNGVLAPGSLSYDGGRRGKMVMVSVKERAVNFLMDEGGTLQVSVHADGDASFLRLSDIDTSYGWSTYINTKLAGTLNIREAGKIKPGATFPILYYHPGSRTGTFDHVRVSGAVGSRYKVSYDVAQPDGSYAVTVTKKGTGLFMVVR